MLLKVAATTDIAADEADPEILAILADLALEMILTHFNVL